VKVSVEVLYHFSCESCKKWWTIADFQWQSGDIVNCPHCSYQEALGEDPNPELKPLPTLKDLTPIKHTTGNKMESSNFNWQAAFDMTKRTAQYGLDQAEFSDTELEKWLLIWSCDIVGELGEAISELNTLPHSKKALTEVGDIIWGISAVSMLIGISPDKLMRHSVIKDFDPVKAIVSSCEILDKSKKICRDTIAEREISKDFFLGRINVFLYQIIGCFDFAEALALVDEKLKGRYPDGYTPKASVNRIV
jgi:hypothetical protein